MYRQPQGLLRICSFQVDTLALDEIHQPRAATFQPDLFKLQYCTMLSEIVFACFYKVTSE